MKHLFILYIGMSIFLISCKFQKKIESKLSKNPFDICYECSDMNEVDSFEQKRGAILLNINKNQDILFFFEFDEIDNEFRDTLSNKDWLETCSFTSSNCDTLRRYKINDIYRFYYYNDTISGLKQITYYKSTDDSEYGITYKKNNTNSVVIIKSYIYLFNKVFSPFTNNPITQDKQSYFQDLGFIFDNFINKYRSNSSLFDTIDLNYSKIKKIDCYEEHPYKYIEEESSIPIIYINSKSRSCQVSDINIGFYYSKYANLLLSSDSIKQANQNNSYNSLYYLKKNDYYLYINKKCRLYN